MTMTLKQALDFLRDADNWFELSSLAHAARTKYVDAVDVSGDAYDYMVESLFEWLAYHDNLYDDVSDLPGEPIDTINAPDSTQREHLLVWAWDKTFEPDYWDMSDSVEETLDNIIDEAASHLENAIVVAFIQEYA